MFQCVIVIVVVVNVIRRNVSQFSSAVQQLKLTLRRNGCSYCHETFRIDVQQIMPVPWKFDQIRVTPVLRDLHRLPILSNLPWSSLSVYTVSPRCTHPTIVSWPRLLPVDRRRHLRSTDTMKLLVRRTRTVIGARDFAVSAVYQQLWDCLPARNIFVRVQMAHLKRQKLLC